MSHKNRRALSLLHWPRGWKLFSAIIRLSAFQKITLGIQLSQRAGPTGALFRDCTSHQHRTQSPWKEKKGLRVDKWWGNKKGYCLPSVVVYRTCSYTGFHYSPCNVTITRWHLCTLTSPSTPLFRRMGLLLKSKISWMKNTSAGQVLLVQYLEPRNES